MDRADKDRFRACCNSELSIPIFSRDWWLDAVCGEGRWDVILVLAGESVMGACPYYLRKRRGETIVTMPPLTQKNGIWMKYPPGQKLCARYAFERKIINEIIDGIGKIGVAVYSQNYDYNFTNWMPFYWRGYQQYTRYTYVIENAENIEAVYEAIDKKTRNQIKRASSELDVRDGMPVEAFYELNSKTFSRQGLEIPHTYDVLSRIDRACDLRGCRRILYASDSTACVHAAIYLIWDDTAVYYLLGASDPEKRSSQAMSLLIWEAIKFSGRIKRRFDFEGSMIEPVEMAISSYGGAQKQYFCISKRFSHENLLIQVLRVIANRYPVIRSLRMPAARLNVSRLD